jgi:hypothetical protein
MKFLVQHLLSFYSLRTLRFEGMCSGTFQKGYVSLIKYYFHGIVNNTEMEKMCYLDFTYVL